MIALAQAMYQWSQAPEGKEFRIIADANEREVQWMSPGDFVGRAGSRAQSNPLIAQLIIMQRSFEQGNQKQFDDAVSVFIKNSKDVLQQRSEYKNPSLEVFCNAVNPFRAAQIAYGLAVFLAFVALIKTRKWVTTGGMVLLIIALVPQTFGIIARMIIMERSPVANLYETFVFVSWSTAVLGLVLEAIQKKGTGILLASAAGFAFLYMAGKYEADGDTMGMLAPVLNNNFWLATHIMTVTLGYAGCVGAGIVAHVYLIRRAIKGPEDTILSSLAASVYGMLAFGLTFTTIGTVLGGLWADQAWGRFWGWDPKENGALLIILWCAILFHSRSAKILRDPGMAIGAVVGLVLVMCAWIGVNLLGVGMHAYGFTNTGSRVLFGTIVVEVVFISAVVAIHYIRYSRKAIS